MIDYSIKDIETLKAVAIKEKIIKIYYIKLSFCSSKDYEENAKANICVSASISMSV